MRIEQTIIDNDYAEAFSMRYTRLLVTAADRYWLDAGLAEVCGYGSSVIGCDVEIGIERYVDLSEAPDGRIGAMILAFGFSRESLASAIPNRVGQCLMTCPSTAVYDGLPDEALRIPLGKYLRYFGDGYQKSKVIAGRRYWRIPVMDGEFLVEESAGVADGIAGGNFLIQATTAAAARNAARRAVLAMRELPGVILPFPGGVARSGSKVGSRYRDLRASTNEAHCPALRGRVATKLHDGVDSVLEIIVDGTDAAMIERALTVGIRMAIGPEVVAISAGNYGGKLGKHHFHLHRLLQPQR